MSVFVGLTRIEEISWIDVIFNRVRKTRIEKNSRSVEINEVSYEWLRLIWHG